MPSSRKPDKTLGKDHQASLGKSIRPHDVTSAICYVGDAMMQIAKALNERNQIERAKEESIRRYGYRPDDVL
jgi:hypothetical protein